MNESKDDSSRQKPRRKRNSKRDSKAKEVPGIDFNEFADFDDAEASLRLRLTRPDEDRVTNIFVTDRTDFTAQFERAVALLTAGAEEVDVIGFGLGVSRAINLSLQVGEKFAADYISEPGTATIALNEGFEDDLHPDFGYLNSVVRIRFVRREPPKSPQKP